MLAFVFSTAPSGFNVGLLLLAVPAVAAGSLELVPIFASIKRQVAGMGMGISYSLQPPKFVL